MFPNISGRCIFACNLRFIGRLKEMYWEAEGVIFVRPSGVAIHFL